MRIWKSGGSFGGTKARAYITPLKYPFTKAGLKVNGAPKIEVYYRGGKIKQPIDVYTKLLGVQPTVNDITYPADEDLEIRDNDVIIPELGGEPGLTAVIKLTATYQAYNDANKQMSIDLAPQFQELNSAGDDLVLKTPPEAYLKDGAVHRDGLYHLDGAYYRTTYAFVAPKIKKDGQSKAVRLTHEVLAADVEASLGLAPNRIFEGALPDQRKRVNIPVRWTK